MISALYLITFLQLIKFGKLIDLSLLQIKSARKGGKKSHSELQMIVRAVAVHKQF